MQSERFQGLFQLWWDELTPNGCGAYIMSKKLIHSKDNLRQWSRDNFGSIKLYKLSLLQELESLDISKETHSLSFTELERELELHLALSNLLHQEELYWCQRSRLNWLKEGDSNTKFFHTVANGRRNRNFISHIYHNHVRIEDAKEIGQVFKSIFQSQFRFKRPS